MSISLLTILLPLSFVIGIGASAIGATAWMMLVPIMFVAFGFDLYQTIFISLLVDCGNALVMTIISAQKRQLEFKIGLKLSVFASLVVCLGIYLGTAFIPDNQGFFKSPAAFFTLIIGLGFIRRGYKQGRAGAAQPPGVRRAESPPAAGVERGLPGRWLLIYPAVSFVSFQTGLFGIGGGMMYSVFLMFCYSLPTLKATGTAMLMTLITTVVAGSGIFFLIPAESGLGGKTIILILLMVFVSMMGTVLGARIAYSISLKKLNYMIGGVILTAAAIAFVQKLFTG